MKITIARLYEIVHCQQVSKRGNLVTFRRSFYYRSGGTADSFRAYVENALIEAGIQYKLVDFDEVYKPFRGGASIANQSHWFVRVTLTGEN